MLTTIGHVIYESVSSYRCRVSSAACIVLTLALGACDSILDVQLPGTVPIELLDNPELAPVLARGAVSDLECGYSGYAGASAAQSDEFETANQNLPLANWGERSITPDEIAYASGACVGTFGVQLVLHTARVQSEDVLRRLEGWTDAQVPGRVSLMAQVRAYGGYSYLFMGETFCRVAFDAGADQPPTAALTIAEQRFTEAITRAEQANNTAIVNMARVGRARARLMLKKYSEAAADAQLVPVGYQVLAERGSENSRRFNDIYFAMTQTGAYVIAFELRSINDSRLMVVNSGRASAIPTVPLWITNKYSGLNSGIRLAGYREAQLILAEALAEQNQVGSAMAILNGRRTELGLGILSANTKEEAIAHVIAERRMELAFEGGHRLNDLLRRNLPWKGANGSTQNANPVSGRPYGTTTCWPLPTRESNGA